MGLRLVVSVCACVGVPEFVCVRTVGKKGLIFNDRSTLPISSSLTSFFPAWPRSMIEGDRLHTGLARGHIDCSQAAGPDMAGG